jgi:hypothetical protein
MLALLLKHMPSCIDTADIEQLVQDFPVQSPVRVGGGSSQDDSGGRLGA